MGKLKYYLMASAASVIAIWSTQGVAADKSDDQSAASQAAATSVVQDVVVTARKRSETLQSVPLSITAFTPAVLRQKQIVSIEDISRLSSGLTFKQSSTTTELTVTIRGQNTEEVTLNLDPAVGIYIDGVYIGPVAGDAVAMNLDDASSVEVLKGPQGTLYGRNTTGGAIKVDHVIPGYNMSGWVSGGAGNYGLYDVKGAITLPLIQDVATLRLYGRYSDRGGYGHNEALGGPVDDDHTRDFGATLRLDPAPKVEVVLRANYDKSTSGGISINPVELEPTTNLTTIAIALTQHIPNAFNPDGSLTSAAIATAEANFKALGPQGRYDTSVLFPGSNAVELASGSVTATWNASDAIQLKSITAYRYLNSSRQFDLGGSAAAALINTQEPQTYRQFSEEVNLGGSIFDNKIKYTLGAFYLWANGHDVSRYTIAPILGAALGANSPIPTAINLSDGTQVTNSYAVYGEATYAVTPRLNITGGLRYSYEEKNLTSRNKAQLGTLTPGVPATLNSITLPPPVLNQTVFCSDPGALTLECREYQPFHFSKPTFDVTVDYRFADDVMGYAKISSGFRSGGGQLRLGGGYPPFGPETVYNYEAGVKADLFDRHLRVDVAAYHDDYSGIQKTTNLIVNGTLNGVLVNAGKARINGVEFDTAIYPVSGLTFGFTGAYTDAKYISYIDPGSGVNWSGQEFDNVPKLTYTISADYSVPTSWGKIGGALTYWHTDRTPLQPGAGPAVNGGTNTNPWASQPAYGLLDGRIYANVGKSITVGVWAKNLTDQKYFTFDLDVTGSLGYAVSWGGAPRTFGADITYGF